MKSTLTFALMIALALVPTTSTSTAAPDPGELAVARDVKLFIAREHKARRSNPEIDFAKVRRLCSPQWTKGCRFWKATSGKDKFLFQVRPKGKIYGIPSMFL